MQTYLKIQSQGEIEIEAFTLIGASSKRGDSTKIGYFGSGLKYSIASLIRNEIPFKVFQGEKEVIFSKTAKGFRGEDYQVITVNGVETSLTTTMGGKDWDLPFAPIREIYSNAIDEDENAILTKSDDLIGYAEKTTIYICFNENVKHFYENFNLYFCNKNPNVLYTNQYATAYPQTQEGDLRLFRKGILCLHDEKVKALYSYNSNNFDINESRVLSNNYGALIQVSAFWKKCDNTLLIQSLVKNLAGGNAGFYEHNLNFATYHENFSSEWNDVFSNIKCVPAEMLMFCDDSDLKDRVVLPLKLLKPLFEQYPNLDILGLSNNSKGVNFVIEQNVSQILIDKVIDALKILRETRYQHRISNIDISYVKFNENDVLGLADDGKIYLSTKLDTYDVNFIAKVIIEENEHNRSGHGDKTREFQNHLFDLYFDELINQ